jgi:hypothetical protein
MKQVHHAEQAEREQGKQTLGASAT